jgi:hypothetical protein
MPSSASKMIDDLSPLIELVSKSKHIIMIENVIVSKNSRGLKLNQKKKITRWYLANILQNGDYRSEKSNMKKGKT